ncbi:MAG: hypothetical protein JWO86_2699 [Myxococcaceae bacterium]|nr:hypothetical protein [Myxococcaceae bacterium]
MISLATSALLFAAGTVGGAINSVAGGGSFLVFPSMLLVGVPPVAANATTAVALWPAGVSSTIAYRQDLPRDRKTLIVFSVASAIGGTVGAVLLLSTSDLTFTRILPLLMLAASAVFTLGPRAAKLRRGGHLPLAAAALVQFLISTYGGYFGGGMGILMLATFTLMGMTHLHAMNGLKTLLGMLINGAANIAFFVAHKVVIDVAIPVAIGAIVGGWFGAAVARTMKPERVRAFVLIFAWGLTAWFFVNAFRT